MPGLSVARDRSAVVIVFCALVLVALVTWLTVPVRTQSTGASRPDVPAFLQVGRCYRFTFPIAGVPNWKVLDILDGGWVRAEADAGPASARRESAWINTRQIITVRDAQCSG